MSIDQRFRAEKLRREIAAMESAKSVVQTFVQPITKPQPPKSCWDDPAFTDRVLAKAERRQEILAEIRSRPKAFVSAKEQIENFVEELMSAKKIDRLAAMKLAAKSRPDLFESLKLEANPGLSRHPR